MPVDDLVNYPIVLYESPLYGEMMSKKILALMAIVVAVGVAYVYKK